MQFISTQPGHFNSCAFRKAGKKGDTFYFETDDEERIVMLLTSKWHQRGIIKPVDKKLAEKILEVALPQKEESPVKKILANASVEPILESSPPKDKVIPPARRFNRSQLIAKAKEQHIPYKEIRSLKNHEIEQKLGISYE